MLFVEVPITASFLARDEELARLLTGAKQKHAWCVQGPRIRLTADGVAKPFQVSRMSTEVGHLNGSNGS